MSAERVVDELRQGWRAYRMNSEGALSGFFDDSLWPGAEWQAECRRPLRGKALDDNAKRADAERHLAIGDCNCGFYLTPYPAFDRARSCLLSSHPFGKLWHGAGFEATVAAWCTYWGYVTEHDPDRGFLYIWSNSVGIVRAQFARIECVVVHDGLPVELAAACRERYGVPVVTLSAWQEGERDAEGSREGDVSSGGAGAGAAGAARAAG